MRAVIFDMDGVIIDSERIYDRNVLQHLKELGVDANCKMLEEYRGTTSLEFWAKLKQRLSLPQSLEQLTADSAHRLDTHFKSAPDVRPMNGLIDFVDHIKDLGQRVALASSARARRIAIILERFQMGEKFEFTISGNDVSKGKPHPEIFELAANRLGLESKDCLVIEDSTNGIRAAKQAGMTCVGFVGSPANKQDLSHADFIVQDFFELREAFPQILIDSPALARGNLFLFTTGARSGEALHLEVDDLDLDNGIWNIRSKENCPTKYGIGWSPKTARCRAVPLPRNMVEALRPLVERAKAHDVVGYVKGKRKKETPFAAKFIFTMRDSNLTTKRKTVWRRVDNIRAAWETLCGGWSTGAKTLSKC